MRILMLGNSFTYFNNMHETLAALTGWEVVSHTRGGAYLCEHLDPTAELGAKTLPALQSERWDYVVLQEQSRAPYEKREQFLQSARELCLRIHSAGAVPVLYCTWAYRGGSQRLADTGLTYGQMRDALHESYLSAAKENGALLADVGWAFSSVREHADLYVPDDYHPSPVGSYLAAMTIAQRIRAHLFAV